MKATHVRISNILGIEELEFDAGQWNVVAGVNGSGKTSVIEAIKSINPGTEDATLLRKGADKGEVVLLLDDGTEIKRRVGIGRGVTVTRDGVRQAKPTDEIRALIDGLSVNPVEFLTAKPKDRVNVLLESLPMTADPARLARIAGEAAKVAPDGAHALDQIAAVRKSIFDDRTGTNRAVKEKEATINQLAATLPPAPSGETVVGDIPDMEANIAELDAQRDAELKRIDEKLSGLRATSYEAAEGMRTQIEELRAKIAAENEKFAGFERLADQQRAKTRQKHMDDAAPIKQAIATLRSNADAIVRARTTRDTIATLRKDADALQDDAARMTTAIDALEAYKAELLASLPIPGLEVKDGEVYRDGIIFDRLNKAQQVDIAVEIAKLRAGDLGIICVDELERLDSEHFEAFREKAMESGLQLFVTRVTDDAFAVTSN